MMCDEKNLSVKDQEIAELIFVGVSASDIARQFKVHPRTAQLWISGDRRPHIAARANELMEVFAKQNTRKLMQAKCKALDVIEDGLNAVLTKKKIPKSQQKDYEEVPDHDVRLRAAAMFRTQFTTADERNGTDESMLTLLHQAEALTGNNGNGQKHPRFNAADFADTAASEKGAQ